MRGLSAMVWQLRMWKGGDPQAQLDHCRELGLDGINVKIVDGRSKEWGGSPTNFDLLPKFLNKFQDAGVPVGGWGWTYGGRTIASVFVKSVGIAREEGLLAATLCIQYGIEHFYVDAEHHYNRKGMEPIAEAYMLGLQDVAPNVDHYVCSYRFPLTHQPNFPIEAFEPYVEGWAPQVYFLGDNRPDGGARQLQSSSAQYDRVGKHPFVGVAPTYPWKTWRASYAQLKLFFEKAKELGHQGISVWDLPQADSEQLRAIKDFQWDATAPPIPTKTEVEVIYKTDEATIKITGV
jgi:hypothetical protein